jgi:CDP-diacylglycerol---glycerol-3-phosphate 3-phosphatidyltransferase
VDLYAAKGSALARLDWLVERLAVAGVSPDALTLAAVPVSLTAAGCLLASTAIPPLLLAIPALALLRLVLNLLDGAVARRLSRTHPRGELLNEIVDRAADVAFLAPVAVLPGAAPMVVMLGVVGAVLASYVGLAARAAGGTRIYRGVLSKPGRMALLSICALAAFAIGPIGWTAFGPLLLTGTTATIVERIAVAAGELG